MYFMFETGSTSLKVGGWVQLSLSGFREGGSDSICVQVLDCQSQDASMYFMFETCSIYYEVGGLGAT